MSFIEITLEDWEKLVKQQLKTENIYEILSKDNLENIEVKPYYQNNSETKILPKVEESTHLVAEYQDGLEQQAFAFLLNENNEGLQEKAIFINNPDLAEHILTEETNRYFSLVDVFSDDKNAEISEHFQANYYRKPLKDKLELT